MVFINRINRELIETSNPTFCLNFKTNKFSPKALIECHDKKDFQIQSHR